MEKMISFLNRLHAAKIYFTLAYLSSDSVTVLVDVPGEKWEIQFMPDGEVAIEKFKSDGKIHSEEELNILFSDFSG